MSIRTQTPPQITGYPKASFDVNAFDALIFQQGYNVLHEESRICPCASRESGAALNTCENCRGFGRFFINPITTKAVVTNINQNPKYMEWSVENAGTIYATMMFSNLMADYDRITFTDTIIKWSESLRVRQAEDESMFAFLTYKPSTILDVFCFVNSTSKIRRLTAGSEYTLSTTNPYILLLDFDPPTGFNYTIAVTYNCNPQYLIVDQPHSLRAGTWINNAGQNEKIDLPVQAVLRRSHLVLGLSDYAGGVQTLDNSYK